MNICVIGGAGYIGSHAVKLLVQKGHNVTCIDNLSNGHPSAVDKKAAFFVADLANTFQIIDIFQKQKIDAVMHFAASAYVGESVADPQKYYVNNVAGTLSLLAAMREAGCGRIVFSSTGAVYGHADSKALPESYSCAPINPYGASKWTIERILSDYRNAYGFGAFCLRYFNASGAAADGGIGELRDNETHLIPRAMMALQGHLGDFAIFGDDYDTPDGTAIRDYIHVTDLAAAHVSLSPIAAADVTQAQADAVFLGERLKAVLVAITVAHRARGLMKQNLWFAAIYNMIAVPIAIAGAITPLIAALAMSGSSLIVTLNALRGGKAR